MAQASVKHASPATARDAALRAAVTSAYAFPELAASTVDTAGLKVADAALARGINHWTHVRWLTLEYMVTRVAKRPAAKIEPKLRALLLNAAAQLLFIDRLPAYAVIDESVALARKAIKRSGAASLANAVLRKLAEAVEQSERLPEPADGVWQLSRDVLPLPAGFLKLPEPWLPHADNHVKHIAAAASLPEPLVLDWINRHGLQITLRLARHGTLDAPTFAWQGDSVDEEPRLWLPGAGPVSQWLADDPRRGVQDPGSAKALSLLDRIGTPPLRVLDYCAGRGTKTRQLATRLSAVDGGEAVTITATDTDDARQLDLGAWAGRWNESPYAERVRIDAVEPDAALLAEASTDQTFHPYDLLLLDVPCSNTGVLARRPEARYRFGKGSIASLVELQREIIEGVLPCVTPGGHLLYVTCSIDPRENAEQAAWIGAFAAEHGVPLELVAEHVLLPSGVAGEAYHDGGYAALFCRTR